MFSCPPRIPVERTLVQSNTLQPQKETENDGAATRQRGNLSPPPLALMSFGGIFFGFRPLQTLAVL
jgi:hypothetical protein